MRAHQSELTEKIIEREKERKSFKNKFEFEGKVYKVKNAPSYKEIEERENEKN